MDKEKELNQTLDIVKDTLSHYPAARDSDMYLYHIITLRLNPTAARMPFGDVILRLEELGLPCFETVRRTRQKVQSEHPELKGSVKIRSIRSVNEEIYKEFVRS